MKLDLNKKQEVKYCIPLWVRDEQIKLAINRIKGRIEADPNLKRPEPVAVACFGPSLNDTWQEIKDFQYVISCSGSHKFLIDRNIIPTWHVEVDPRKHKVALIGQPHHDVEYLISSTCHPAVFDHLEGYNVKLWHVFDNQEDGFRTLPPGEWALTGGCSVGLRAMLVARFLGFTNIHIFGMDGNEGPTGKHADEHPSQAKESSEVDYEGVTYRTTQGFLEAARQTWHELDQMVDVEPTFHGEGLVQAMAKNWKRRQVKGVLGIGIKKPELISAEYVALNTQLHHNNIAYGANGGKHAKSVIKLVDAIKAKSILDYGCGKGYLAKSLNFPIWEYDPAIPGKESSPRPADLVVCTDVLEHIEPEKLNFVLNDLQRCTKVIGYFTIFTKESTKTLPDGRNAHLIQEKSNWWKKRLEKFFTIGKIFENGPLLIVVVSPKIEEKGKVSS